ncbi:MAG: FAD-dependent oxidoreductase [Lachnospiraceae bacterium]|jgi:flavin-dependent dehydrogenase|nr:FAD-dependent oxidoreductase [Lachnospiraceae bacterium]
MEKETIRYSKEIPLYKDVDVVVAGAGPAGIGAAVCAARAGAKTLIFDQAGCVGGMATIGLVGPFMTCYDAQGKKQIIKGVFEELVERMAEKGGAIHPDDIGPECSYSGWYKIGHNHVGPFDHECLKREAAAMLKEAGADILLHTSFVDVLKEEGRITGVVIHNKAGLSLIRAKQVIDCTGDGDVAVSSGEDFLLGNGKGEMQSATLFFRVYNVDSQKLDAHIKEHRDEIRPFYGPFSWLIRDKKEEWGIPRGEVCLFEGLTKGEYRMNVSRLLHLDGTNPDELTRGEIEGMAQTAHIFSFLKKYAPGFENAVFMGDAATLGLRETRHIKGKYCLTGEDVLSGRVREDSIAVLGTSIDMHNEKDEGGSYYVLEDKPYYGVPFACLVPEKTENLLVAGRSISADETAFSSIRMIPCCIAFGQAAGTAAAMALQQGNNPADINPEELRQKLREQNVYLGE